MPSTCTPSTTSGPVHPLGVRSTIAGQRGRVVNGVAWISRIFVCASSSVAANCSCIVAGSSPATITAS